MAKQMKGHIAGSGWGAEAMARHSGIHEAAQEGPSTWRNPKWERTPRYHWRSWTGYVWRKWDIAYGGAAWIYQTNRQRAKQILEEQFNASQQSSVNGPQRASSFGSSARNLLNATRSGR